MELSAENIRQRLAEKAAAAKAAATPTAQAPATPARTKRDTGEMIVRQTCIKAAAEFCGTRSSIATPADVLKAAEEFENWCWR